MGAEDFEDFRRRLYGAFPPRPFHGLVSTHDECDDGDYIQRELSGKQWDDLPPDVLLDGVIALPLLEPDALVAFLPAWLLRSMQDFSENSAVLEFTLYFLCPGNEDDGWDEKSLAQRVALFDSAQKRIIEDFLRVVSREDALWSWPCSNQGRPPLS